MEAIKIGLLNLLYIHAYLLSKADNHDALSLCICMYVYMCIRPTQPETPRLHNCPQFVHAMHDNWDVHFIITSHESTRYITSSLCAAFSSSFPLPFTQPRAKWLLMRPPFWLLSFTPHGPDPCPGSLGKEHKSAQCEAGLMHPKYVGVDWTAHTPCVNDKEAIQPIVRQARGVTDQHYC